MEMLMGLAACCTIVGFAINCIDRLQRRRERRKKMTHREE